MPRKRYSAEQIIVKLHEEVMESKGKGQEEVAWSLGEAKQILVRWRMD